MAGRRTAESMAWQHLYNTRAWKVARQRQLQDEPLCRMCRDDGLITAASVCDHIEPHKGDRVKFFAGPFQSLCKRHHDGEKKQIEMRGFSKRIGGDGWPVCSSHPANKV